MTTTLPPIKDKESFPPSLEGSFGTTRPGLRTPVPTPNSFGGKVTGNDGGLVPTNLCEWRQCRDLSPKGSSVVLVCVTWIVDSS